MIYVPEINLENQCDVATPMKVKMPKKKKHLQHFVIENVEIYRNNLFIQWENFFTLKLKQHFHLK